MVWAPACDSVSYTLNFSVLQTPYQLVHLCRTEMPIPHFHSCLLPKQLPLAERSTFPIVRPPPSMQPLSSLCLMGGFKAVAPRVLPLNVGHSCSRSPKRSLWQCNQFSPTLSPGVPALLLNVSQLTYCRQMSFQCLIPEDPRPKQHISLLHHFKLYPLEIEQVPLWGCIIFLHRPLSVNPVAVQPLTFGSTPWGHFSIIASWQHGALRHFEAQALGLPLTSWRASWVVCPVVEESWKPAAPQQLALNQT